MIAFNDDPELQDKFIAGLEAHYAADAITQGVYEEYSHKYSVPRFRGCAIGCMAHTMDCAPDNHRQLADAIGVPEGLLRSVDRIHEGLSPADSKEWPLQFGRAIKLGDADLEKKLDMMVLALMVDPLIGVLQYAARDESKAAIEGVAALYRRKIAGDSISRSKWTAAASAATYASASAAASAATYAATYSATYAASYASVAAVAAATATATAASSVAYEAYSAAADNAIYDETDTEEVVNAVLDARLSALNAYDAAKDALDRVKEAYWRKVRDHLLNLISAV